MLLLCLTCFHACYATAYDVVLVVHHAYVLLRMLLSILSLLMQFLCLLAYCAMLNLCVHDSVLCNCLYVYLLAPMLNVLLICLLAHSYAYWLIHMLSSLFICLLNLPGTWVSSSDTCGVSGADSCPI
jgi:hypothetical protein